MMYEQTDRPEVELEYCRARVLIRDARPELATGRVSLEKTGSQLVQHSTALSSKDFYNFDAEEVRARYYDEVCKVVKEVTGAETVVAIHHQVRNERRALELVGGDPAKLPRFKTNAPTVPVIDGYAVNAHADFSDKTAARTAREQLHHVKVPEDRLRHAHGRYMMVNAWRNISDSCPILNHHLAVLDASSLAPEDIILVDMYYETFSTECAQVAHSASERHRWLYFPGMLKDELLLFKQFDSDHNAPARFAVHCSFVDPTAPASAPGRESIEVRTVAFFPSASDHTEGDEVGLLAASAFPPAIEVAQQLLKQLESPELWPEDMRQWLRSTIPRDLHRAASTVIAQMVDWNSDPQNADGLIAGAPASLRAEVLQLLRESNFAERLHANFGSRPQ